MNRLQSELQRLYLSRLQTPGADGAQTSALVDAAGRVRCLVLELKAPPSWEQLAPVWQGVQAELEMPAPAIAVSGTDGLQLWFSLAEPIAVAQAHAFLERLRLRYLPDVKPARVRLLPAAGASALHPEQHAALVPALQATGDWSAFIAQDLAPVFAETPWLDIEPGEDGQAALLQVLAVTPQAVFEAAWEHLGSVVGTSQATAAPASEQTVVASAEGASSNTRASSSAHHDAQQFLLRIMNDDTVALGVRIDAAKALLQSSGVPRTTSDG